MTYYLELAAIAIDHAQRYFHQQNRCEQLAHHVAANVSRFLGAPEEAVRFVALDDELNVKWNSLSAPVLIQGADGWWHFGLLLHFELPGRPTFSKVALRFGLRCFDDHSTIKLMKEYTILPGDASSWEPLLRELFSDLEAQYSDDPYQPPKPIGFIQNMAHASRTLPSAKPTPEDDLSTPP